MPPEAVPSNASVASTGLGIRYIGQHCYAYSGRITASSTTGTYLEFTTGSGYIVGEMQFNGYLQYDNISLRQGAFQIQLNGEYVAELEVADNAEDMPFSVTQKVIIPPLTKVEITARADDNDADNFATITLVGRVYE